MKKLINVLIPIILLHLNLVYSENNYTRVFVIGGGVAGIAAVSRLYFHKFTNVTLLEASPRLGGRILTQKVDDNYIELGAEWIFNANDNIVSRIAKEHGILRKCVTFQSGRDHRKSNGTIIIKSPIFTDFLDISRRTLLNGIPDDSLSAYLETRLNQSTIKHKCAYNRFDGFHNTGFSTLIDILLRKYPTPSKMLPVDIKVNTEVKVINYGGTEITIETYGGETFVADKVILTVPLGYLQSDFRWYNMFNPKLPIIKSDAIKSLKMITVNKIFLQFDRPWWPPNFGGYAVLWSHYDFERLTGENEWLKGLVGFLCADNHQNFLVAYIYGKYAEEYEKIDDDIVNVQIMDTLRDFVDSEYNITEPISIIRTKWHANKFYKGSFTFIESSPYSYIDIENFATPLKNHENSFNLFFAGEATTTNCSSVPGAIESGFRAADECVISERFQHINFE